MNHPDGRFALRSRRIVTLDREVDGHVVVWAGRIAAVVPGEPPAALHAEDLGALALLPGLVDTHVHVNEPGRTEWEGFATASRAALAGGVTTIVDMPLNSVPATTTVAALEAKRAAAAVADVRVEFWGGVVPGNTADLAPLARAGVRGFKCFLVPSGVDEFPGVGERELRDAMPEIARTKLPLLAHCELPGPIEGATAALATADPRAYATWLASRPPEAEVEAIRLLLRLAAETKCRVHVVHLATAAALPDLRAARAAGRPVTVETCPHYLTFAAEDIAPGATEYKCAPPIRGRAERDALWRALLDGDIDLVASDHSPCPPAMKRRDTGVWAEAWGGIASLELGLPVVWTEARRHGATLGHVARWMSAAPADLAGLAPRAGRIEPGADADLVAFDPDATWSVDTTRLHQRHPLTPYAGRTVTGRVARVWRRGVERAIR